MSKRYAEKEAKRLVASEFADTAPAIGHRIDVMESYLSLYEKDGEAGAAEIVWEHMKVLISRFDALGGRR